TADIGDAKAATTPSPVWLNKNPSYGCSRGCRPLHPVRRPVPPAGHGHRDFLVDPDVCNGWDGRRVTGRIQAVHLFQRGQHVVVGYRFAICAGFHVRAVEDGWDLVVFAVVVLVPGDHQQAVVGLCPRGVGGQVVVQPGIALGDG